MGIVKKDRTQILVDDLIYREKEPETIDVQFMETAPITKMLYKFNPLELGVIQSVNYAFGPNDNSINGFAYLMLTRIPNPSFYATDFGQNQVMWRKIIGADYKSGRDYFNDEPLYMHRQEPFYLYLATNYPTPTKVYGHVTLYCLSTGR